MMIVRVLTNDQSTRGLRHEKDRRVRYDPGTEEMRFSR